MPYTDLLKRAFELVRRERALWVLGFIFALFGGGGGSGANFNPGGGDFGEGPGAPPTMPDWVRPDVLVPLALVVGCVLLLLIVVGVVVQNVALAGMIVGADRAARGEDVRWRELWRVGWSWRGRRLIALWLLLVLLPALLFVIVIAAVGLLMVGGLAGATSLGGAEAAALGAFFIPVLCCLVPFLIGLVWSLDLVHGYAARAIVLNAAGVLQGIESGWRLFRRHLADSFVYSILLGVLGIAIGVVLAIILGAVGLLVGIPALLLMASQEFALPLILGLGIPIIVLFVVLAALLQGPLLAFFETAWTLAWRHLTTPAATEAPLT